MKETTRRSVLFAVIVITGSVLILVDIPLLYLIPLIIAVGFFLLVLLGSITVTDIKKAVSKLSLKNLRYPPFLKKLESVKLFEKKTPSQKNTGEKKTGKSAQVKPVENSGGIRHHLSLLASSVASFGKILTEHKKTAKKPEEINKLLEHTITEKVSRGSALESAASVPEASGATKGGAGGDSDPFLSLSGEELETSLLDGLDEMEPGEETSPLSLPAVDDPGLSMPDLDMPALPDELSADADAILKANASDTSADELQGPDGEETVDDTMGDLDSINLDEIDLGDDGGTDEPVSPDPVRVVAAPASGSGGLIPATPITLAGQSATIVDGDQSDMSSFASGTSIGSDEDMLSSLASDIKQVKKEQDVSLLRDLKDFKAPATDIEKELLEMSEQLNAAGKGVKKKISSSTQGMK